MSTHSARMPKYFWNTEASQKLPAMPMATPPRLTYALFFIQPTATAQRAKRRIFSATSAGMVVPSRLLHVMAIDRKGGKAALGMGRHDGREVHGAGAPRAVEAPDGLDRLRVHVKRLRAVAPAGGD